MILAFGLPNTNTIFTLRKNNNLLHKRRIAIVKKRVWDEYGMFYISIYNMKNNE